jgi:membrane protein implicated in regulation of membrane protease activity
VSSGSGRPGQSLFTLLWYLRLTVYFSLGFGPVGLVAILVDSSRVVSLIWAVAAGLITAIGAYSFFRFQRNEFDSSVQESELVGRPAEVTISILPGEIGRVRIQLEQLVRDRYARAESSDARFNKGERVVIARIDEECVYVREANDA